MALNYQTVKKRNPAKPTDPEKFYANAVYKDKMTLRKIATEIAERTSLSSTDSMAVLEALTQVLPFFLLDGNIVYLGEFGTFRISLRSDGAETAETFTSANIKGFKLLFRAGKELSEKLKHLEVLKS
jgi:predicted histone-like DNA-binding protein